MGISIPEVLTQAFAFILLVFLLKKFAWKPLLKLLDERRQKIQLGLAQIERTKSEVDALKSDYEQRQAHIQEEMRKKLQQAIAEGKLIAKEIQEGARGEARALLEKAKTDIQLETEKAKIVLKNEIADLAVSAAERLIQEKMDAQKDKGLALRFIKELEQLK
ncbi:MAG: ATP synthase F0 subunit B [Omnitrophica bacterium RIFCSPLOWO2_01_FULL_50_24]|nr:MAG: ATP synthase F0 subunit B [Omnitrophica bacterium RIFCSPLOWO2_01_FULL_50_24]